MGHANSQPQLSRQNARKSKLESKPKRQVLARKLKMLTKHGMNKKRKNLESRSSSKRLSAIFTSPFKEDIEENVILPTHEAVEEKRRGNITGFSKHSLLSYALSKLAVFAKLSREKLSLTTLNGSTLPASKFSFHDHKPKPAESTVSSVKSGSFEPDATSSLHIKSIPSSSGDGDIELLKVDNEDSEVVVDVNNNKSLRDAVVKRLLSSTSSIRAAKTPEELYRKNLEKFETLLAITATTTSEEDTDSVDDNNNVLLTGTRKQSRIISSSKNRVEVDAYFLDWIKSKLSTCSTKKESSEEEESSSSEDDKKSGKSSKKATPNASAKASKTHTNKTNSKASVKKKDSSSESGTGYGSGSYNNSRNMCIKRGPCAGKGFLSGAPPAYLDYGCAQTYPGAACRKGRDPVIDRLKNVDVVEQLTYMVPDPCCEDEEDEEDDCDYYAVCESCGEMEPLPEELQSRLKKKNCKKKESKPVTYSRRQRFNFKNQDDDDDGPPFRYDGTMGKSCRCPCCVAGLRRDPNCGCKCCQVMGNARRVNSFDEIPVGKNPQIRRILCPMEAYEKKLEQVDKILPEQSGVYQFDPCDVQFERQVPRTPTPIILEVPRPRGFAREEVLDIAKGLTQAQMEEDNCCYCNDPYVEVCEPEPEPIYLPPIFGQFNPCCPPCCEPDEINNNYNDGSSKSSTKKQTTKASSGSDYNQSGSNKGSKTSSEDASAGTGGSGSGSGSLPSVEMEGN